MTREISAIIKEWKEEAGIDEKHIILVGVYSLSRDTIKICTDRPGWMIGKHGVLHDKYLAKLQNVNTNLKSIEFVETDSWYIR